MRKLRIQELELLNKFTKVSCKVRSQTKIFLALRFVLLTLLYYIQLSIYKPQSKSIQLYQPVEKKYLPEYREYVYRNLVNRGQL